MPFDTDDCQHMARALRLAERGYLLARPNPRVGCIIVNQGKVVGEGYHQRFGEGHAEVNALAEAGEQAKGATCYVTLEPCAHQGKTGACAKALIQAGVKRVVAAMRDPNPKVDGGGFALLQQAGIQVESGLMEADARAINPGFISRMTQQRPYVRCKLAMSLDGRTAMASGESLWITGAAARSDVQKLRARHDGIITGLGTLTHDNPSLNVRFEQYPEEVSDSTQQAFRQPVRILADRDAKADLSQQFFAIRSPIWWVGHNHYDAELPEHIERRVFSQQENWLQDLLTECARHEMNEVLIEAGAELAGAFVQQGLVDELVVYMAPKLMGSDARPLVHWPLETMSQAQTLVLTDMRQLGSDMRLTYRLSTD
ncbi:bifunctional diaminohydroxyphosphoribosylaminopyrimidine deaminase/5-amino-6-(5-phosphoribosylamino)uracil reductase RibD [Pleionea sp. CnH1-48]|uniref:bifunctional diaminohydroxyphosphoribosylaminopyrimidine deaminase/5-amino-6-(5-phosphoribosylamino)uracil reductase RibD n=1 Tax=Pleionea sp. CnH1-48 TaxID=2954494 RepID=UPI0020975CC3|nr:bifunctional diaminohydroxyphosphoribosylaminopyrimidine deaminase/5-amino-6-(5-phosphoribosylamino)uracil reductase RibD [Pleionea sp. CnH1-48]MCO7225732.1 bifunctional diaminohydroxyphosphoribosylaminopyrimidine deaminase/5-amino-6-(5-phosphoribosylamino)uracil reductase RibD [Pleionea sp. CnH1-48]